MNLNEEKFAMDLFLKLRGIDGQVEKTESPDYLIKQNEGVIGIEFTEVVNRSASNLEHLPVKWYGFEDKVLTRAKSMFQQKSNAKVFVSVDFNKYLRIDLMSVDRIAITLVEFIIEELRYHDHNAAKANIDLDRELISKYFNHVSFDITPEFEETEWVAIRAKMAEDLVLTELVVVIEKKEKLLPEYRRKAATVYLVIVDGFGAKSWYAGFKAEPIEIHTGFDSVFLLRVMENTLIELN